jgi:hypothetical protein
MGFETAATENGRRLGNVLRFAGTVIEFSKRRDLRDEYGYGEACDKNAVFALVKMFADKINADRMIGMAGGDLANDVSFEALVGVSVPRDISDAIYGLRAAGPDLGLVLRLGKDPLITGAGSPERLLWRITVTGGDGGSPWLEDDNHQTETWLPMGISFILEGRHSSEAGRLKGEGEISAGGGRDVCAGKVDRRRVMDASPLFGMIRFDGESWRRTGSGGFVVAAASFEFGCVFEIGRLLAENGLSFADKGGGVLCVNPALMSENTRKCLGQVRSRVMDERRERGPLDRFRAKRLGLPLRRLSVWEERGDDISLGALLQTAELLGVPLASLLPERSVPADV